MSPKTKVAQKTATRRPRSEGISDRLKELRTISLARQAATLTLAMLPEGWQNLIASWALNSKQVKKNSKVRMEPETLYIVQRGELALVDVDGDGTEIKKLGVGAIFGESALLGQSMHGLSAVTVATVELKLIDRIGAEILLSTPAATQFIQTIGERKIRLEADLQSAIFQTAAARVAKFILHRVNGSNTVENISHKAIGDELSLYRETVTNAIADLKRLGLISMRGHQAIVVTDRAKLKAFSQQ